jgi:DNA polymerase delta subunit 1
MDGKRAAQQQGGPPAKRGPPNPDFDDDIYDDMADEIAATLPEDLDEADPELGEAGRNWTRPPVAPMDPQKDSLGTCM